MRAKGKLLYRVEKDFSFLKNNYIIGDTFYFIDGIPKHRVFVKSGMVKPFKDEEYRYFSARNLIFKGKKYKFGDEIFDLTFNVAKKYVLYGMIFQETIYDIGKFVAKNKDIKPEIVNIIETVVNYEQPIEKTTIGKLSKQFENLNSKDLINIANEAFNANVKSHLNNIEPDLIEKLTNYLIRNGYKKAE
jgi:hypothetical protein